jgi:hypothetical protein
MVSGQIRPLNPCAGSHWQHTYQQPSLAQNHRVREKILKESKLGLVWVSALNQ